jgi:HK97 family phage major capsid protein
VRLNEAYIYEMLGFPVNLSNQIPTVTNGTTTLTNNKSYGCFGNPKHIVIGDRMQFTIASSGDSRFSYDQTEFRATQRLAIAVALPSSLVRFETGTTA